MPQAGTGMAQPQPSPVCVKPRGLDFPQGDRCLGLKEAGTRQSRMMVSSTTDFRLLKAGIRSRKGRGNKVLGSLPEQEPLTACCLEQCWLPRTGAFVKGFVGSLAIPSGVREPS